MNEIQFYSWVLNFSVILFAFGSLAYLIIAVKLVNMRLVSDNFKRMLIGFLLAGLFSAIRWSGGSLAMLNLITTDDFLIEIIWTFAGMMAALFTVYSTKKAIDFSKEFHFRRD